MPDRPLKRGCEQKAAKFAEKFKRSIFLNLRGLCDLLSNPLLFIIHAEVAEERRGSNENFSRRSFATSVRDKINARCH